MHFDEIDDNEFEISDSEWALHQANTAYAAQKNEEAAELYEQALAGLNQAYGDAHPEMPLLLWNYGNALYNLNKFNQAIPLYNRLITIQEEKLGKHDTKVVATLFRLATVYERIGDFSNAERTYDQALTSAKVALPPDHPLLQTLYESCEGMAKRTASRLEALAPNESLTGEDSFSAESFSDQFGTQFGAQVGGGAEQPYEPLQEDEWEQYAAPSTLTDKDLAALNAIPTPGAKRGSGSNTKPEGPQTTTLGRGEEKEKEKANPKKKVHALIAITQSLEGLEQDERMAKILHSPILMFGLTIVLIMTGASWFALLKSERSNNKQSGPRVEVEKDFDIHGKTLTAADNQTSIEIDRKGQARLVEGGKLIKGPVSLLEGNLVDAFKVIPGSLFRREIWFEETPAGLRNENGAVLYFPDAPEETVVQRMEKFAEFCQDYYRKGGSYPADAKDCQTYKGFQYLNAFTHKGDAPYFSAMYVPNKAGMVARLREQASKGESWINEPALRAGAINCCALVLNQTGSGKPLQLAAPTEDSSYMVEQNQPSAIGTNLFIRGCDRDGHYLQSSKAGSVFFIELSEGKSKALDELSRPPETRFGDTNTRIIVTKDIAEHSTFAFFRNTLPPILFLLSILCGVAAWGTAKKEDEQSKQLSVILKMLSIATAVVIVLWYLFCMIG
jgi:tetratricopeptide (TPR) repeat protein